MYRFDVTDTPEPGVFAIDVECSSGTYVRVLAADLGAALGGGAHLRNLRRLSVGSFTTDEARPGRPADGGRRHDPAEALRDIDLVVVDDEVIRHVSRGLALDRIPLGVAGDGPWGLIDADKRLLAVYEATDTDRIRPAVVLEAAG